MKRNNLGRRLLHRVVWALVALMVVWAWVDLVRWLFSVLFVASVGG